MKRIKPSHSTHESNAEPTIENSTIIKDETWVTTEDHRQALIEIASILPIKRSHDNALSGVDDLKQYIFDQMTDDQNRTLGTIYPRTYAAIKAESMITAYIFEQEMLGPKLFTAMDLKWRFRLFHEFSFITEDNQRCVNLDGFIELITSVKSGIATPASIREEKLLSPCTRFCVLIFLGFCFSKSATKEDFCVATKGRVSQKYLWLAQALYNKALGVQSIELPKERWKKHEAQDHKALAMDITQCMEKNENIALSFFNEANQLFKEVTLEELHAEPQTTEVAASYCWQVATFYFKQAQEEGYLETSQIAVKWVGIAVSIYPTIITTRNLNRPEHAKEAISYACMYLDNKQCPPQHAYEWVRETCDLNDPNISNYKEILECLMLIDEVAHKENGIESTEFSHTKLLLEKLTISFSSTAVSYYPILSKEIINAITKILDTLHKKLRLENNNEPSDEIIVKKLYDIIMQYNNYVNDEKMTKILTGGKDASFLARSKSSVYRFIANICSLKRVELNKKIQEVGVLDLCLKDFDGFFYVLSENQCVKIGPLLDFLKQEKYGKTAWLFSLKYIQTQKKGELFPEVLCDWIDGTGVLNNDSFFATEIEQTALKEADEENITHIVSTVPETLTTYINHIILIKSKEYKINIVEAPINNLLRRLICIFEGQASKGKFLDLFGSNNNIISPLLSMIKSCDDFMPESSKALLQNFINIVFELREKTDYCVYNV